MAAPEAPSGTIDLGVGDHLGEYRVTSVLQRGGMGEVFLADDLQRPGRQIVIKRLLEDYVEEAEYREMFEAEAAIMARLDHPNVVRVFETRLVGRNVCLLMEFVRGRNLGQVLRRLRELALRMPPSLALFVMQNVLRGLHCAHTATDARDAPLGLVHRDVSPANILLSFEGEAKLTDFGIAKSNLSLVATSVGVVKGTTSYLSPEQVRGSDVTPRSDLFAAAVVLLELLSGRSVFDRGQVPPTLLAIVKGQRPPVSSLLPFRHAGLELLLEQALAISPTLRPASAAEMADQLDAIRPELGPLGDAAALGAFVRRLFPESDPAERSPPSGAAYILEPESARASGGVGVPSGARPLNAKEFETPAHGMDAIPPALLAGLGDDPSKPLFGGHEAREDSGVVVHSGDIESVSESEVARAVPDVEGSLSEAGLSLVEAVEAASRELEATEPPPRAESVDSSDSAAEADAFHLTSSAELTSGSRDLHGKSFALGAVVGGALVAATLFVFAPPSPGTAPAAPVPKSAGPPPVVAEPASEEAATDEVAPDEPASPEAAPPPGSDAPTAAEAATEGLEPDDSASDEASAGEVASDEAASEAPAAGEASADAAAAPARGFVTIDRPRRARVYIDGIRLSRRVPIERFNVVPGQRRIVIRRGSFRREFDVKVEAGQHLDLSGSEVRVVREDGGDQ